MSLNSINYYVSLFFLAYVFSILYFPFEIGGTSIVSRVLPILFLTSIIVQNIKGKNKVSNYALVLIWTIFLGGVGSFFSVNSFLFYLNFSLLSLLSYFASICMLDKFGIIYFYRVLSLIVLFSVLSSVLGVLEYYFYDTTLKLWFFRGTPYYFSEGQVSSLYSNPNIFGIMSAISMQLVIMVYKVRHFHKLTCYLFVFILFVGVVYSGGRMAQAVVVIVLFYNVFCRVRYSPFIMVAVSYMALITMSLGFGLLSSVIDLNFRDIIWDASKDIFFENIFFGVGMGNIQEIISNYSDEINWVQGPNNYVWGFLAECGIAFFSLFSYVILRAFWRKSKYDHRYTDVALLMSIMLISQFSEHFLIYVSPYVMIFFLVLAVVSKTPKGFHFTDKNFDNE